jgi:hypothetical protein
MSVRDAFAIFDTDNSGFLDRQQFKDVLLAKSEAGTPLSEAEVGAVFDRVDADNSGSIDIEEFIAWSKRAGDYNPGDFGKLSTIAMPDGDSDLLSLVMANPGEKLLGTMEVNLVRCSLLLPPHTSSLGTQTAFAASHFGNSSATRKARRPSPPRRSSQPSWLVGPTCSFSCCRPAIRSLQRSLPRDWPGLIGPDPAAGLPLVCR